VLRAARAQGGDQRIHQPEARHHRVGDDEHLPMTEARKGLPEPRACAAADQQHGLGNRQKARHHAGCAHRSRQRGRPQRVAHRPRHLDHHRVLVGFPRDPACTKVPGSGA
jgi:hypothetical protein